MPLWLLCVLELGRSLIELELLRSTFLCQRHNASADVLWFQVIRSSVNEFCVTRYLFSGAILLKLAEDIRRVSECEELKRFSR